MGDLKKNYSLEFRGNAREYFKIWIVNIGLSILTLGIYSAWAKVRNKKYFYGNTFLDGSSFNYTANPVNILKGRIITAVLLFIYIGLSQFAATNVYLYIPLVLFVLLVVILIPWFIQRTLCFNARYSSYRNVNFSFDGKYFDLFLYYVLIQALTLGSAGLAAPAIKFMQKRYQVDKMKYGNLPFRMTSTLGDYYKAYIFVWIVSIVVTVFLAIAAAVFFAIKGSSFSAETANDSKGVMLGGFAVLYFFVIIGVTFAQLVIRAGVLRAMLNGTKIGELEMKCNLKISAYMKIMISNFFLTIVTLGLYHPWARVKTTSYLASTISFDGTQEQFETISNSDKQVTAIGDEAGDFISFDIGF